MENMLGQVETKDVLIDYINVEIRKTKQLFSERLQDESQKVNDRLDKLILEELTHEDGFFGKEGSITLPPEEGEDDEDVKDEGGQEAQEGEKKDGEEEEVKQEPAPRYLNFQFTTLKEYMVETFKAMQVDIKAQMERHEQHIQMTTNKFEQVDKRTDVDLEGLIADVKMQSDGINERLFSLQKEQLKPLKDLSATMETDIQNLKDALEEIGLGQD